MDAYLQTFLQQFQHLRIPLEEIKSATDNFHSKNCIGVGGFGKVYKGEVSHYKGRSIVAIKRLSSSGGQGTPEFLKEITTLSRYNHENLISVLGFSFEEKEMILVYEHASRGSLDHYLNSPHLAWSQRVKICLDAAKGLSYLHDPRETHQRLIHCDVKSANILLDDGWNAKVSDFGLSIMGSANEQQSLIVTAAAGTPGYCDPQYAMTHTLTKESDVYSFGVVLFEVLCGTLCCIYGNGRIKQMLVPKWIESYKQNKLNDIIFHSPTIQPLDPMTLEVFSDIACRCLNESREDRPTMSEVVTELETALESLEFRETDLLYEYEEMTKSVEPPLKYRSKFELWKLLFKGVLLNKGKTWFTLNKKGEHCEMICIAECLVSGGSEFHSTSDSRFAFGPYHYRKGNVKVRVKTQFLSPGITYTVNLMFRNVMGFPYERIAFGYKLEGETKASTSGFGLAYESEDGYCWMCELYQFNSEGRDHEILFEFFAGTETMIEGIEFRPLDEVKHADEKQPVPDTDDANLEEKLPTDYEDIMKQSKDVHWTTKKEAYLNLREGFLINDGQEWISLDNNGKKCLMLSVRATYGRDVDESTIQSSPESRFGEALQCEYLIPYISCEMKIELLSSETTYATYLIYKLPKDQSMRMKDPIQVGDQHNNHWSIYLIHPQTPVIRPKAGQNTHNPLNRPKLKGFPRHRNDGWMEVQIWEYRTTNTKSAILMFLQFYGDVEGLIIQGFECRPVWS